MVALHCAAAGCCGVAYETVTTVASPAHHTVNMAAALRGDGAMKWRVWGGAVQSCNGENRIKKLRFEITLHTVVYCNLKLKINS